MMRRSSLAIASLVLFGAVSLWPRGSWALNPNHQCEFCHVTHFASGGQLLDNAVVEVLCLTCHGPAGTSSLKADVHTNTTGSVHAAFRMTCKDCHTPHSNLGNWLGGTNLELVGTLQGTSTTARIATPNSGIRQVVFQSRGSNAGQPTLHSFADNDQDGNGYRDGVCETCHTQTAHHRNNAPDAAHFTGATCVMCHPHNLGFIPTGGTCTSCHSLAQNNSDGIPPGGRRAIVGEFSFASHHLHSATLNDADCEVCHEMTRHQQGRVRLKNADDPNNPARVVVLNADPATSYAEAVKLETFCLVCHDTNGAAGLAPFSDRQMPPVINNTLWPVSSHKSGGSAGPMTCYGDGARFGCHATGHGSQKRKILAPANATQPPIAGDPLRQGEGMCYTCHGPGGVASTNIQAQFQLASHHKVSSLDQTDGSRIECTNCHNPHLVSAAARLANPDTSATTQWTGTGVAFCLTCHDGAPPSGVTFPATDPGTGWSKSRFPGTTHATALAADACRRCHHPHGSANLSTLLARYVIADNNLYTIGDGDYAMCWTCHSETAIISNPNAYETRHDQHVRDKQGPCIICHDAHGPFDTGEAGLISYAFAATHGYSFSFIGGRNDSTAFSIDTVQNRGSCYLRCHGEDHTPRTYSRANALGASSIQWPVTGASPHWRLYR